MGAFDFLKQTQFEAVDLEELGFLKIDFLYRLWYNAKHKEPHYF